MSASTAGASARDRWRNASTVAVIDSGAVAAGAGTGADQSNATVSAVSPT